MELIPNVLYRWTYRPAQRFYKYYDIEKEEYGYFTGRYHDLTGWPVMRTASDPVGYMLADPNKIRIAEKGAKAL